jgi:hypothetical protein
LIKKVFCSAFKGIKKRTPGSMNDTRVDLGCVSDQARFNINPSFRFMSERIAAGGYNSMNNEGFTSR